MRFEEYSTEMMPYGATSLLKVSEKGKMAQTSIFMQQSYQNYSLSSLTKKIVLHKGFHYDYSTFGHISTRTAVKLLISFIL